jgi:hypothetical protein
MALKDIFGQPNEGIHAWRIGPFAAVDTIGTVLIGLSLSWYMRWPIAWTLIGLLTIGETLHYILGVKTALIKELSP